MVDGFDRLENALISAFADELRDEIRMGDGRADVT
jgi:hypothetical protein